MSYHTYDRNQSGIAYFGVNSTDQIFESNANFVLDVANSQLRVPNIVLANGGKIGSASQTGIVTFGSDGVATFSSGVVINGDLTVQGSQVILNTEVLNVEDNIVVLNSNTAGSPTMDAGLEIERGTSDNVRMQWDEGNDYWSFTNNGLNYYRVGSNSSLMAGSGLVDGGIQDESRVLHVGAGTGIAIASNSVNVSPELISGRAEITSVDGTGDYLLLWDATDSTLKKVNRSNFVSGLGSMSGFTIAADGGSSQTINDGNTVTFSGGGGISTTAQNTDTIKIDLDISEYSNIPLASGDSFLVLDSDNSTEQRATVTQLGSYLAGTNVTAGGDGKLSVTNSTVESVVFTDGNFVDGTTIDFSVTSGDSVTAEVKNGSITEVKLSRTVASLSSNLTISSDINLVTGGSDGVTVTLPSPATGKIVVVKKVDSGAGAVTISAGASTVDGAASKVLYYQYESLTFVSDGTNWFIV